MRRKEESNRFAHGSEYDRSLARKHGGDADCTVSLPGSR
jgi:hypothetical protein